MYKGTSDHDAFGEVLLNTRHTIVYNGDITDLNSFNNVQKKFIQIKRFMIGRGLLANPFLAESIKGLSIGEEPIERLKAFHDDLFENYKTKFSGPGHLTGRMKGLWRYLGPSCFKNSSRALKNILKSNSILRYHEMVEKIFLDDVLL